MLSLANTKGHKYNFEVVMISTTNSVLGYDIHALLVTVAKQKG